jgi:hypothetical protein
MHYPFDPIPVNPQYLKHSKKLSLVKGVHDNLIGILNQIFFDKVIKLMLEVVHLPPELRSTQVLMISYINIGLKISIIYEIIKTDVLR